MVSLTAVCALGYSNSLTVPFVFDDFANVRDNPNLRIQEVGWENLWNAAQEGPSARRPVAKLSFALNYYFGHDNVRGYHVVNLAIHIGCSILVYLLGREVLSRPWPALAAALIFASHPLQTQAVTYIVQRMTCLATLFYLAALLCYVRGRVATQRRRWRYWGGTTMCGLLAFGSKEIAGTLPLAILLYEWYFFQNLDRVWLKRVSRYVVPAFALLVAIVLLSPSIRTELFGGYAVREFTMWERLLTEPRVVAFYLSLVIWPMPSRLSITHDIAISHGLIDPPTTILSILAIVGLLVVAWKAARRVPIVSFCVLWVLLHLAIESTVIPLELVYEHRMYLPLAGASWLAAWALFAMIPKVQQAMLVTAGIVVLLVAATYARNRVWQDGPTLWADVVAKYPLDARAYNNLGSALASQGRHDEAIKHHRRALELKPGFADAHNNLGIAAASREDLDAAIEHYRQALASDPEYATARNNLGNALAAQGDLDAAVEQYYLALQSEPNYADAHYNLGVAMAAQGDVVEAAEHYRAALRLNPRYYQAANNLGALLAGEGKLEEAVEQFRLALRLEPEYIDALSNLGSVLAWQEKYSEAREHLSLALELAEAQGSASAPAIQERLESLPK